MAKKKNEISVSNESIDLISVLSGTDGYKISQKPEKEQTVKSVPYFEICDAVFKGNRYYINNMTDQQAKQNIFMVLRKVAIGYPEIANAFNRQNVNAMDVIKFLSVLLPSRGFPSWYYTKTSQKKEIASKNEITKNDITVYIQHYGITRKDFESAMRIFPEETIKDVIDLRNFIKNSNSTRNEKDTDNE